MMFESQVVYTVTGGLVAAIGVLWKTLQGKNDKLEKKQDDTTEKLVSLSKEVGELRGRVGLAEELKPEIRRLHEEFLRQFKK